MASRRRLVTESARSILRRWFSGETGGGGRRYATLINNSNSDTILKEAKKNSDVVAGKLVCDEGKFMGWAAGRFGSNDWSARMVDKVVSNCKERELSVVSGESSVKKHDTILKDAKNSDVFVGGVTGKRIWKDDEDKVMDWVGSNDWYARMTSLLKKHVEQVAEDRNILEDVEDDDVGEETTVDVGDEFIALSSFESNRLSDHVVMLVVTAVVDSVTRSAVSAAMRVGGSMLTKLCTKLRQPGLPQGVEVEINANEIVYRIKLQGVKEGDVKVQIDEKNQRLLVFASSNETDKRYFYNICLPKGNHNFYKANKEMFISDDGDLFLTLKNFELSVIDVKFRV